MKRIALGALVVLLCSTAFAEQTSRYLVATRRPAREVAANALSRSVADPGERHVNSFDIVRAFAADLTPSEVAALKASPDVRWVEPLVERHLMAVSKPGEQIVPYGISQIHAPEAWAGRKSVAVNVAVIDSGVDHTHPELRGAWAGGHNIFDENDPNAPDEIGHGTHVAGTIAAGNNEFGVVGVAPGGVRLWGVKAFDASGNGSMEDVIAGLDWVVKKKQEIGGRWVVNMSLGGHNSSDTEREAFSHAAAEGIILVAASGNDSLNSAPQPVSYPAAYDGVIAVGAVDDRDTHPAFSNQGPELDFVAPGVKVVSTELFGSSFLSYIRNGVTIINAHPLEGSKLGALRGEYVFCGAGAVGDFPPSVRGKIALIRRGGDTFADKTRHAKDAGAIGVAIFNNDASGINWTLYPAEDPDAKNYPWPVTVAMSQVDGEALVTQGGGHITIGYDSDDYDDRTGTSMSTPHVAGAFALLWSMAPDATPASIYNALVTTAKDLGPTGKDDQYGYGEIDVFAAAKMLAPEAFVDSPSGPSTGRRFVTRRKH